MLLAIGSIRLSWPFPQAAPVEYVVPSFQTFTTKGQPEDGIRDQMDISLNLVKIRNLPQLNLSSLIFKN